MGEFFIMLLVVLTIAGVVDWRFSLRRKIGTAIPLERRVLRLAALVHTLMYLLFWISTLMSVGRGPWWTGTTQGVQFLLIWTPLFIAHLGWQFWMEGRAQAAPTPQEERESYRDGYADGRRDALRDAAVRLNDEGELLYEDDKPKREGAGG